MTMETPDAEHHFSDGTVQRFGARCFVILNGKAFFGAPVQPRYEISAQDFEDVCAGRKTIRDISREYDTQGRAFMAGIAEPSLAVKVFLIGSALFLSVSLIAVLADWV